MFLHQFGENLVFLGELVFQVGHTFSQFGRAAIMGPLEGIGAVFEELFLPTVKDRGVESVLVAQIGDRYLLKEVPL
jgi:hypothetical protein